MIKVGQFPNLLERQRLTNLTNYHKLYELKQRSVLGLHDVIAKQYKNDKDIVYIGHAIPSRVSEFYGDFVQGDVDKMIIDAADSKEENDFIEDVIDFNDLKEAVYDYGVDQSEFGYLVLHVWKDEEAQIHIEQLPQDQYFPQSKNRVIIATYRHVKELTKDDYYVLTQEYTLNGTSVSIERKAWKCDGEGVIQEEISLDFMAKLLDVDKIKKQDRLDIDTLPFVVIPNGRTRKNAYGKSDYFDIMPQLAEVNERTTHISTQLIKNLDAKMVLPASMFNEDGKMKPWEAYAMETKDEPKPEYILHSNPLLQEAREHIMMQLKMISWISSVPMFALLKEGMPERVEALRIQLFEAIRRTDTKRAKVKRGLQTALFIASKLNGKELQEDAKIDMSDVLPVDELQQAETEQIKIAAGISSRKSAMKRIHNLTEEEAEEELKQIREEDKVAGVVDPDNPPRI